MARQYCRYCAFCFEADDFRCSNHPRGEEPHWTEEQIKRVNNCPNFSLSDDVITGKEYHPRPQKPPYRKEIGKDFVIMNEYDEIVYFDNFFELVDDKQEDIGNKNNPDNFRYARNVNGYRFTDDEFS